MLFNYPKVHPIGRSISLIYIYNVPIVFQRQKNKLPYRITFHLFYFRVTRYAVIEVPAFLRVSLEAAVASVGGGQEKRDLISATIRFN